LQAFLNASKVTNTPLNKLVSADNAEQLRRILLQHVLLNDHFFVSPYYSPVFANKMELQTIANVPLIVDTMCGPPSLAVHSIRAWILCMTLMHGRPHNFTAV
jgi:hypothetical protein